MTNDKTVTMSRERRPVCHACVSRQRDEYCPVCDLAAPPKSDYLASCESAHKGLTVEQAQEVERGIDDLLFAAPVVERQETVPKHKFDTLVQHCKRLDAEIAQARAHVNEITLYQQNAVWFWQHDGEDYLQSLSCPIIIQPHHLRELLEGQAQHNPIASPPAPVAVDAAKAFAKGFNTLETVGGKHKIVMQFAGRDDAWDAYEKLSQMTACLDKVKDLNQ